VPILASCWVLASIAAIVVAARVYAQARILHQFGWGDAIMILAMVCDLTHTSYFTVVLYWPTKLFCFTHIGLNQAAHLYGFGRHFFYLDPRQRVMAIKLQFSSQPMSEHLLPASQNVQYYSPFEHRLFVYRYFARYTWPCIFDYVNVASIFRLNSLPPMGSPLFTRTDFARQPRDLHYDLYSM
jgi:hypothetical protein